MTNKWKHTHGHPTPHPVLDLVPTTQRNPEIKKKKTEGNKFTGNTLLSKFTTSNHYFYFQSNMKKKKDKKMESLAMDGSAMK